MLSEGRRLDSNLYDCSDEVIMKVETCCTILSIAAEVSNWVK